MTGGGSVKNLTQNIYNKISKKINSTNKKATKDEKLSSMYNYVNDLDYDDLSKLIN